MRRQGGGWCCFDPGGALFAGNIAAVSQVWRQALIASFGVVSRYLPAESTIPPKLQPAVPSLSRRSALETVFNLHLHLALQMK